MSSVIDLLSDSLKSVIFAKTKYAPTAEVSAESTASAAATSITEGAGLHAQPGKRRSAIIASLLPTNGK